MARILIVDHFGVGPGEKGNNRFNYLALLLAHAGYEVHLLTSSFSHRPKAQRPPSATTSELPYKYTTIFEPGYQANIGLGRVQSHRAFGVELRRALQRLEPSPDLVYVAVPSLDAGIACTSYCESKSIPLVVDIQDVWPEAFRLAFNVPVLADMLFLAPTMQANRIYRSADAVVAVSNTYLQRAGLCAKPDSPRLCVYLGTDLAEFDRAVQTSSIRKPADETWVAYVGTLGHSYDIPLVIDSLAALPDYGGTVVFKLLGNGPLEQSFRERAANRGVRADFVGLLDYHDMVGYLSASDIAVNPIVKGAQQSITNKQADYAAAGLPVISSQQCSEYVQLLDEYKCGFTSTPGDPGAFGRLLSLLVQRPDVRGLLGCNARQLALDHFDRRATYPRILDLVSELLEQKAREVRA